MRKFFDYLQTVARINALGNGLSVEWLFYCGMLFSSMEKWWGDFGYRRSAHEGIDITYFRTPEGETHCFDASFKVPAMDDGVVVNICDDFLGQTLVVEKDVKTASNRRILYAYAHILPESTITVGHTIREKQVVARVCDTLKNPLLPPHLHFSCFDVPTRIEYKNLDWNLFSKSLDIHPIHPVFL